MMFRTGIWLWLCIGQNVLRGGGGGLNGQKEQRKSDCYQLNRLRCSFRGAQHYCHRQGGQLTSTWSQDIQDRLKDYLEEGTKWWIGPDSDPLIKHKRKVSKVGYVYRTSNYKCSTLSVTQHCLSAGVDCKGLISGKAKKEKRIKQNLLFLQLSAKSTILCQEISTNVLVSSGMAQTPEQILLPISPSSKQQPLPMTTKFSKPLSETSSEKPASEVPAAPKEPPYLYVFTTDPPVSFQNTSYQVFSEAMENVNRSIHDFQLVQKLQRACEILQQLKQFASRFSKTFQINGSNRLLHPSEPLLKVQSPRGNPLNAPVALCPGNYDMEGSETSIVGMEDTLETSLIALGKIQEALLPASQPSESSMIVTSSLATLMLRSQNISTLSSSSYTLGYPAPMHLGFPSASALDDLLSKHQSVNIHVTGLAFNPFKHFDEQDIVGSVGNVLLTSNHKSLQIQDLLEEAEIILWRDGSIETYPTSFNMRTDCFVITVNITSLEESLIVWVEPENPLSITLYLGFQYQPNSTHFHLNITLPKEQIWEKDEKYSWVLSPESLQHGTGTYYITAVVNESKKDPKQTFLKFSVTTAATQCYFWDHHNKTWKSDGCRVGPQSTITKTQCLCSHLTSFHDTVKLFHGVSRNPVGVSLLASLLGFYIIFVVWAWRKDKDDRKKMKVTILADNAPSSQAHYLVQVFTGYRRRAATTGKVILILYGSEGRSDPHHLSVPPKVVFEQGAQDVFLVTTRAPLGQLHSIQLWHDNSGTSPSWYVNQVIVSDLATKNKWHFLCNCWLTIDLGDCQQDQVFTSVSKKELFSFRNLYSSTIVEKFTQEHLWLSMVTCSLWSRFTRVQRLSCCMTLLICNMAINIMFWKLNSTEEVRPSSVTWSELLISIQTASILFPINLIIGRIFPLIQPQEKIPPHFIPIQASSTSDTSFGSVTTQKIIEVSSDIFTSTWNVLSEVPENIRNLNHYLLRVMERLQFQYRTLLASPSRKPHNFLCSASQLQSLRELMETQILSMTQGPCSDTTSFPMLDSEEEKPAISNYLPKWSISICWLLLGATSLISAFFTALYSLKLNKDQATSWVISMILSVLQNTFIIQPVKVTILTLFSSLLLTRISWHNKEKEQQMRRILALLAKCPSLSPPGLRDENNPIYRVPPVKSPVKAPERTMKEKQLFQMAREIFVQILFLIMVMISTHSERNYNRFYLNQAIQKRINNYFEEIKCIKDFYQWTNNTLIPNLYGEYRGKSHMVGTMHSICPISIIYSSTLRTKCIYLMKVSTEQGLAHQTGTEGGSKGRLGDGLNSWGVQGESWTLLPKLSVFFLGVFFSSIKVNSLQIIQTPRSFVWFIASKVIYCMLLFYHIFTQGNRLKQEGWKYFTKKSNALDTSIILISFIMLALKLKCFFLYKRNMAQYHHNKSRFISFHEALHPRLQIISATLKRAWDEVAGFLLIILILLTGYSITFNILFGWSISDYRTFFNSAVTIVGLLMGIFDYHEVVNLDPVLGSFLIITSVILLVLVIINLFASAIMLTFCKERKSIMKEAPLTEILLQKLSNLLGIRRPQKAALPEPTDPAAAGINMEASENEPA
uniref:Polycystin 1 like 3, transient receptor potential channel interacting n=1 Tax=Vombatus ursinus TaxID=29139 RepID=A0A4X2LXI2_VOMUR